jgi:hypothetical protein
MGAVRSGLIVAPDPAEDPSAQVKVLARAKNNLVSKAAPTAVRYRLVSATEQIGDIPAQEIVCVEWLGVSHYTAWDLLDSDQERGALGEAVSWLRERLATAPEPKQDVVAAARADARIATRTLERAAAALGVFLKEEKWWLPPKKPPQRPDPSRSGEGSSRASTAGRASGRSASWAINRSTPPRRRACLRKAWPPNHRSLRCGSLVTTSSDVRADRRPIHARDGAGGSERSVPAKKARPRPPSTTTGVSKRRWSSPNTAQMSSSALRGRVRDRRRQSVPAYPQRPLAPRPR